MGLVTSVRTVEPHDMKAFTFVPAALWVFLSSPLGKVSLVAWAASTALFS